MSGHTPGPWAYDYENDTGPNDDYFVEWYGMNGVFRAYREEDAALIASAPDLLEALESLTADRLFYYDGDTDARMNVTVAAYKNARAAIARAKGEK